KTEVNTYLQQRRRQALRVREQNETQFDPSGVRERLLARKQVGEYFFKEIDGIVSKLCDDFEAVVHTIES
ncbi:MAG: hypothetical protein U9O54_04525, partial [Chloroflexota bacterium]|nr:hypothetical protein [Chloroflexota bacterium]